MRTNSPLSSFVAEVADGHGFDVLVLQVVAPAIEYVFELDRPYATPQTFGGVAFLIES